ncbi:MAG: hypothetical protein WDO69_08390 [Pseudomonadota bacterium]
MPSATVIVGVAVLTAVVGWQLQLIGDYRVDDAYISFAFAKNLAAGHGLTYGADLHVEGYSNFLWTLLAGLVQLVAPNGIYPGMRVLAFACLGLTLFYTFRLSARFTGRRWAWLPPIVLVFATDLTGAAQSALETIPYTAALVVTVYYYLTEKRAKRRISGWCFLLLALVRIDGIVHVAFFLGFTGLAWLVERRRPRTLETLRWLLPPSLAYLAYFAWRYNYYGLPLPTTYYAKSLIHVLMPNRGAEYVSAAVNQLGLYLVGAFALFGVVRRPSRERLLLALLVVYHAVYISYVGGDWMPFHRFLVPVLPFLAVLFSWGAFEAWKLSLRTNWAVRFAVGLGVLASAGYVANLQDAHSIDTPEEAVERDMRVHVTKHTRGLLDARGLYRWLIRAPGEKLVTDYGGVFAYYTDAAIIEMWGLCNAEIALRGNAEGINPIYGKTCIDCYREFQPDYFHTNVPLLRRISDFNTQSQVISAIFQAQAIGRVLDFNHDYVTGRVVDRANDAAFYFLERKRPGVSFVTRSPAPGIVVEYPFLEQGREL